MNVRARCGEGGFTLLELLVVLLIVGLGIAVVTLNVGGNRPLQLLTDARGLANGTAAVADSAVLDAAPWGLQFYRETVDGDERIAYRWLRFGADGWRVQAPPELAASARFGSGVEAVLVVEGSEVAIEPLPAWESAAPARPAGAVAERKTELTAMQRRERERARKKTNDEQGPVPDIWLAPGGEMTPFELQLRFVGETRGPVVRGDALGRIELERPDGDA